MIYDRWYEWMNFMVQAHAIHVECPIKCVTVSRDKGSQLYLIATLIKLHELNCIYLFLCILFLSIIFQTYHMNIYLMDLMI